MTSLYNTFVGVGTSIYRTVQPKVFKLDSKPISVKIRVNPDPKTDNMTKRFDQDCAINQDAMKYSPVKLRFYHNDFMTSKRKLLWFESDLKTNVRLFDSQDHSNNLDFNPCFDHL